jgi:hypothetical protein
MNHATHIALGELYSTPGASHQTMRKPSPISRLHLHTVIKTHAASSAGSAPFRHFHRVQSEQTPNPSMMFRIWPFSDQPIVANRVRS